MGVGAAPTRPNFGHHLWGEEKKWHHRPSEQNAHRAQPYNEANEDVQITMGFEGTAGHLLADGGVTFQFLRSLVVVWGFRKISVRTPKS